ncbi:hypothetical protein LCGC14_0943040 [marine sediment metagenome]|uniref:Hemerythrin-like domain-containing protein n=1 Tax=marine sediment metagenome TaxID=412755 RepID=A0A0F9NJH7_9ZZZZ|nr:DUF438 domain-containing protein [Candidatus Aminicenantes bacterium]HEB34493.1 DUF438 domain-containing protein [Candidatus Aminicenantes bacterium]
MSLTNKIDVKGLEHQERERLIFPRLDELKKGERLRIIMEFNPVPLVYLLEAREEFEVFYEKDGPAEWILNVKRIALKEDKKKELKELLTELKGGKVSDETKKKAKDFFRSVDAKTLGVVEQELIREGVSHDEVRKGLCDIHLEVLKDTLVAKRIEVSPPHPVHTLMEEHQIIQENLKELSSLVEGLRGKNSFKSLGEDLEKLREIAHHLVEAESHHQREEDVLFPALESHDIVEPPQIMKMDHEEFRKRKKELYKLAHNPDDYEFKAFKEKVIELGEYLTLELEGHIFKEDNILYQIALQVLSPEEWEEVKRECDKMGYCCFTPEDVTKGEGIVELDLRSIPPFERHVKIFQSWESLEQGQALRIINDHDPKPLHYQFKAEEKGKYEWEYEQEGPKDWIVKIKRI